MSHSKVIRIYFLLVGLMKYVLPISFLVLFLTACGGESSDNTSPEPTPEEQCINDGGYWWDNQCNTSPEPTLEEQCINDGGYWWDNQCNTSPEPTLEEQCINDDGYWWHNQCHSEPKPTHCSIDNKYEEFVNFHGATIKLLHINNCNNIGEYAVQDEPSSLWNPQLSEHTIQRVSWDLDEGAVDEGSNAFRYGNTVEIGSSRNNDSLLRNHHGSIFLRKVKPTDDEINLGAVDCFDGISYGYSQAIDDPEVIFLGTMNNYRQRNCTDKYEQYITNYKVYIDSIEEMNEIKEEVNELLTEKLRLVNDAMLWATEIPE
ncbi:TPA: hypothetical protein KDY48_003999 [Vibrio parahaemolyticus]|nr:hypothetical protein [Vibrio parahaemolyticus]HBC3445277.1 hypothetical protein [Vibrio parahaemolyticus]HBC3844842.1 hypothetical protein [Vibrio parahaemolyticus]